MRKIFPIVALLALLLVSAYPTWQNRVGRLEQRVRLLEQQLSGLMGAEEEEEEPETVWNTQVRSWCGPGNAIWEWRGRSEPAVLACSTYAKAGG